MQSPKLLVWNQMAGPMTWELVEDLADRVGPVALLTGHPDTLSKPSSRTRAASSMAGSRSTA